MGWNGYRFLGKLQLSIIYSSRIELAKKWNSFELPLSAFVPVDMVGGGVGGGGGGGV